LPTCSYADTLITLVKIQYITPLKIEERMKQKSRRSFFKKARISLASFSLSSLLPPVLANSLNRGYNKAAPEVYFTTVQNGRGK